MDWQTIAIGTGASLTAGLMTGVGALPVLAIRKISHGLEDGLLGFAAGVMLAASFLSLIVPGIEAGTTRLDLSQTLSGVVVLTALLLGGLALWAINTYAPHEHFISGRQGPEMEKVRRIWLFIAAITLHNLPEGLAVGVGFGADDTSTGVTLAVAIGLQNAPEGLSVALALASLGYRRWVALAIATGTGALEALGGFLGVTVVTLSEPLLPGALGFAAGAMLFVISHEIIPETHRQGRENVATWGLLVGLVVMTFLDSTLG